MDESAKATIVVATIELFVESGPMEELIIPAMTWKKGCVDQHGQSSEGGLTTTSIIILPFPPLKILPPPE